MVMTNLTNPVCTDDSGVSDTGLDDESCFFYDSARGRVKRSSWDSPVTDMAQRKVRG
jgi:hypothetical protein